MNRVHTACAAAEHHLDVGRRRADVLERIVTSRFAGVDGGEAFRVPAVATEGKVVIDRTC